MANYRAPYEDFEDYFFQARSDARLEQVVRLVVVANDSMKDIGKIKKAPDLLKYFSDADVIIEFNENIFEQLEDEQRQIVADDFMSRVSYNYDKDKIEITKPDVVTSTGIIDKYGTEKVLRLSRTIKEIHNQEEDRNEYEGVAQ